jgi:hypothetical protein
MCGYYGLYWTVPGQVDIPEAMGRDGGAQRAEVGERLGPSAPGSAGYGHSATQKKGRKPMNPKPRGHATRCTVVLMMNSVVANVLRDEEAVAFYYGRNAE